MSVNQDSINLLVELADKKYRDPNRTDGDLMQSRSLFQVALDSAIELYGRRDERTGRIFNSLGLVLLAFEDRFDEGEEAFEAAALAYKARPAYEAIVLNNHADLLLRKGKLVEEEIEELKEELRKERDPKTPLMPARRERLAKFFSKQALRLRNFCKRNGTVLATGQPVASVQDELTATMQELTEIYRRAAEMKSNAILQKGNGEAGSSGQSEDGQNNSGDSNRRHASTARASNVRALNAYDHKRAKPVPRASAENNMALLSPAQIFAALDEVAIGQRAAKRGLANAASQHMKRMQLPADERAKTDKSNVLIMGQTGCGKTLLAEALARCINVPFYRTEATKLTASGYVGEDVQSVLSGLLRACDFDGERAQTGIIFIDEIDKKATNSGSQLDVGGKNVQEELLTILEGTKLNVAGKNKGESIEIDTTNILFIVGGAFVGLGDIVKQRLSSKGASIGFSAELRRHDEDTNNYLKFVTAADFIKFGIIPELVGRLPVRLFIETLTVKQLERILTEPTKALLEQKRTLLAGTTDLKFTCGSLRAMAEEAHKIGTNGRALREIVEQVLEPVVFSEPKEFTITENMVRNRRQEIAASNLEEDGNRRPKPDYIIDDEETTEGGVAAPQTAKV